MYLESVLEASETAESSDYRLEKRLLDGFAFFEPLVEYWDYREIGISGSRYPNLKRVSCI